MTKRDELKAIAAERAATATELRTLLVDRQRELRAVRGAFDAEGLLTADLEEVTQHAARELALRRIVEALAPKAQEAGELSRQAQENVNALALDAQRRSGYIDRLVRDLGPGGRIEKHERAAQAQLDIAHGSRREMERLLSEAKALLQALWGDAPIPKNLGPSVNVAQDIGDW